LYHILNSVYQRGSSPSYEPLEQLVPPALLTTVARARQSVESKSPLDGAGQIKYIVQCANRLKRASLLQLNIELEFLLEEAKKAGDFVSARQFQQQMLTVQQQLRTLHSAVHLHV
jgi:DNA primase